MRRRGRESGREGERWREIEIERYCADLAAFGRAAPNQGAYSDQSVEVLLSRDPLNKVGGWRNEGTTVFEATCRS